MGSSPRRHIASCVLTVVLALSAVTALGMMNRTEPTPDFNGVLIPAGRHLQPFSLVDHLNQPFTQAELLGRWHMVTYGYTHCPDVCPTTLMTLAKLAGLIENEQEYDDIRFLFYTVDPERDTVARLAEYVPWFNDAFVGLTQPDGTQDPELAFEQSLGMVSVIEPIEGVTRYEGMGGYSVGHGLMIYLLNPSGDLQAVFTPETDEMGIPYFAVEQIHRDYRAVRAYLTESG